MGRRKRKHTRRSDDCYLNAEMYEIQQQLERDEMKLSAALKHGSANHTQSMTTHYSYAESHIHKGDKVIYEAGGKQLFAGNGRGVNEYSGAWELIIDLASNLSWPSTAPVGPVKDRTSKRLQVLRKYTSIPPVKTIQSEILSLDWPDGGIISAGLDFWLKLWSMLPARTVMMCIGGHGRTGTCMVALMIANGENYYTALDTVRKEHCTKAVETTAQARYLHDLYVEYLKRQQKLTVDPDALAEIETAISYALDHKPTSFSYWGEPEPPKVVPKTSTVPTTSIDSDADIRLVPGKGYYERICVDLSCRTDNCNDSEHLGWVPCTFSVSAQ